MGLLVSAPTPNRTVHRLVEHQPGTVTVDVTYRLTIPATWKTDGPVPPFVETVVELAVIIADALTIDQDDAESMGYDGTLRDGSEPVAVAVEWVHLQEIPAPPPTPWSTWNRTRLLP
jgi:hypothetical protein